MVIMSVALGPTLLGHSLLSIARLRPHTESLLPAFLTSIIAAGTVVSVILSGVYLIDAFSPYIWYQGQDMIPLLNTLNQLLGCLLVSVYTLFSVAALLMAADSLNLIPKQRPLGQIFIKDLQPNNNIVTNFNGVNFLVLFLSFSFIFILTLFLPHVWAITYMPVIAWNAYFVMDSPYSLISGVILYQSENLRFSYQNITTTNTTMFLTPFLNTTANSTMTNDTMSMPSLDSMSNSSIYSTVNITTLEYLPDPNYLQPTVYLKLYETVVVYYSVLFLIVVTGIIGTYYAPLRRYFHKRINMSFIPKRINLWPVGASVGKRFS